MPSDLLGDAFGAPTEGEADDPCASGDHYHCDAPRSVAWTPHDQAITVTCCCGQAIRNEATGEATDAE